MSKMQLSLIVRGQHPPGDIVGPDEGPLVPAGKPYVLAPYSMLVLISEPEA